MEQRQTKVVFSALPGVLALLLVATTGTPSSSNTIAESKGESKGAARAVAKGSVGGMVAIGEDTPVRNAKVVVQALEKDRSDKPNAIRDVSVNRDGTFLFSDLPYGNYRVSVFTTKAESADPAKNLLFQEDFALSDSLSTKTIKVSLPRFSILKVTLTYRGKALSGDVLLDGIISGKLNDRLIASTGQHLISAIPEGEDAKDCRVEQRSEFIQPPKDNPAGDFPVPLSCK